MVEFLQSYGILVSIGLFFSLMLWRAFRGHSMGCCGGHQHEPETVVEGEQHESKRDSASCH